MRLLAVTTLWWLLVGQALAAPALTVSTVLENGLGASSSSLEDVSSSTSLSFGETTPGTSTDSTSPGSSSSTSSSSSTTSPTSSSPSFGDSTSPGSSSTSSSSSTTSPTPSSTTPSFGDSTSPGSSSTSSSSSTTSPSSNSTNPSSGDSTSPSSSISNPSFSSTTTPSSSSTTNPSSSTITTTSSGDSTSPSSSSTTSLGSSSTTTPSSNSTTKRSSTTNPSSSSTTTPSSTNSTVNGTPKANPTSSSSIHDYVLSFAELLSAITAEFVFNVAGDHVLFPVSTDSSEDRRLHTTATVIAELLQKLHLSAEVYQILNTTTYNVAEDAWKGRKGGWNLVSKVMQQTVEAMVQDPMLRDEYLAAKQRVENQIFSLPAQHGRFASSRSQTLYDVRQEQLTYAERLMEDARVKRLILSVTFFKASQFQESSVPIWVRSQTELARAVFELAKQPKWRDEVQRLFDEAVAENEEKYDAMGGDDEAIFGTLKEKFEKNAVLHAKLKEEMGKVKKT